MNKSKLLKVAIGLFVLILFAGICFAVSCLHFFTHREFITDDETIPWEVADNEMMVKLSNCNNEYEKVCKIREFAYSHIDWGSKPNWQYGDSSVYDIYDYYENDKGGAYCGLAARYLTKLYDHYGFKSCTYDMGDSKHEATHVTVVVQIDFNGKTINTVQDPTFNFTIVDTNLQPIDLLKLVQQIAKEETNFKILESETTAFTEYLTDIRFMPTRSWNYISGLTRISPSNGQRFKYSIKTKRTLQRYVERLGKRYFRAFDEHELPHDMISLFVMPINKCECTSESLETTVSSIIDIVHEKGTI